MCIQAIFTCFGKFLNDFKKIPNNIKTQNGYSSHKFIRGTTVHC